MQGGGSAAKKRDSNDIVLVVTVLKHSWKGQVRRQLILRQNASLETCTTGQTSSTTNHWKRIEKASIAHSSGENSGQTSQNNIQFEVKVSGVDKTILFSANDDHQRALILEKMNEVIYKNNGQRYIRAYDVKTIDFSSNKFDTKLLITSFGLNELNNNNKKVRRTVYFSEIKYCSLDDEKSHAIIYLYGDLPLIYESSMAGDIIMQIKTIKQATYKQFVNIKSTPTPINSLYTDRLGSYSDPQSIISLTETACQISKSDELDLDGREHINLCISCMCLIERCLSNYTILNIYDLRNIVLIVRSASDIQAFSIEFINGRSRNYRCVYRDLLISSLIDAARGVGNTQCTMASFSFKCFRNNLYSLPVDLESEISSIKLLQSLKPGADCEEVLCRFISNISYDGSIDDTESSLFQTSKTKLIIQSINTLISFSTTIKTFSLFKVELVMLTLKRLLSTKRGYKNFSKQSSILNIAGFLKIVEYGVLVNDDYINYLVIDCICCLVQPSAHESDLETEQRNKSAILNSSQWMTILTESLGNNLGKSSKTLFMTAIVDFFVYIIARPFSDTTPNSIFDTLLALICSKGRSLFRLFNYHSLAISKNSSLIFRAIIEESNIELATKMQELSVYEGTFLKHLYQSLFQATKDVRVKVNQQVSRELLTLWVSGNKKAVDVLYNSIPKGLLDFLYSDENPPATKSHYSERNTSKTFVESQKQNIIVHTFDVMEGKISNYFRKHWQISLKDRVRNIKDKSNQASATSKNSQQLLVLRNQKRVIKHSGLNWPLFFYKFTKDWLRPNLIWNQQTRSELSELLESNIKQFDLDRQLNPEINLSWNYKEFYVIYASLESEIKVGDFYLRPLVHFSSNLMAKNRENNHTEQEEKFSIGDPNILFSELNHKYMIEKSIDRRVQLLKAMSYIYSLKIGEVAFFKSIMYIFNLIDDVHAKERDSILILLTYLVENEKNAKEIIINNGLSVLCQMLPICHLETERAVLPFESDVLTLPSISESRLCQSINIWYYSIHANNREGPISFNDIIKLYKSNVISLQSKIWTQGFTSWIMLEDLPQFKYIVLKTDYGLMGKLEASQIILDVIIEMNRFYPTKDEDGCLLRPMPRIKHYLCQNRIMSIIVNLILTYDPKIIDKTTQLLLDLCQDNLLMSQIYRTGVYFFLLMYPGSNITKIVEFLRLTHLKQSYFVNRNSTKYADIKKNSILHNILPEALIYSLSNLSTEKFVGLFLADSKTPEVIWNSNMRNYMINKIAVHVSDFTPYLNENILANYEFAQIPHIKYEELDNELFCHGFYLKYLCKAKLDKYFLIPNPVEFLKTLLVQWEDELKKEPNSYTLREACKHLDIEVNENDQVPDHYSLKTAYRKQARIYHPDNTTTGDEKKFMEIQKAYEFICNQNFDSGPNSEHLHYYIQSQIILLERHKEELSKYKYPGYEAIFSSITRDFKTYFGKSEASLLMIDAILLIEATLKCSGLNSLELMRIGGIKILSEVLNEATRKINSSNFVQTDNTELSLATSILSCIASGGLYPEFIDSVLENLTILENISVLLLKTEYDNLLLSTVNCIAQISNHIDIQIFFYKEGCFLTLIKNCFDYDFTFNETEIDNSVPLISSRRFKNDLALKSAAAISNIASFGKENVYQNAIKLYDHLLTPFITKFLYSGDYEQFLKLFTTTIQNPNTIWNNKTRDELNLLLNNTIQTLELNSRVDLEMLNQFNYTDHKNQLIVSGIFIDNYNFDPTFKLDSPNKIIAGLINYLTDYCTNYNYSNNIDHFNEKDLFKQNKSIVDDDDDFIDFGEGNEEEDLYKSASKDIDKVCLAFRNIINSNSDLVSTFVLKKISSLLNFMIKFPQSFASLYIVESVHTCLETTSDSLESHLAPLNTLGLLVVFLAECIRSKKTDSVLVAMKLIQRLSSLTKLLSELFSKGILIHLLLLYVDTNAHYDIRQKTLELLSVMLSDKLVGPRVALFLPRFVPKAFVFAITDAPETGLVLIDKDHDTPEMLWNAAVKNNVQTILKRLHDDLYSHQKRNSEYIFSLPEDFRISFDDDPNGIFIGDVNLRRYAKSPDYILRKPDEFMINFMNFWNIEIAKILESEIAEDSDLEKLDLINTVSEHFFAMHSSTLSLMQQIGTLSRLVELLNSKHSKHILTSSIILIKSAVKNIDCADQLIKLQILKNISLIFSDIETVHLKSMAEFFTTIAEYDKPEFSFQFLNNKQLISNIMNILQSSGLEVESPAELKAMFVGFLKRLCKEPAHGESIKAILDSYPVWSQFALQDHSLYLTRTEQNQIHSLEAGQPKMAGYLLGTLSDNLNPNSDIPPALE